MGTASDPFSDGEECVGGDALRNTDAGDESPAAVPAPPPNFCTRCGAPWDPSWTECPTCARAYATPSASAPLRVFSRDRSLASALALYFALLATSAVSLIMIHVGAASQVNAILCVDVVDSVIVVLWLVGAFRLVRPGLFCSGKPLHYLAGIGLGCVTFLVATVCVEVLVALLGVESTRISDVFLEVGYGWGTVLVVVCVQPALIEELAFRGVILSSLQGTLGLRTAVIVSSFMFMILHLAPLSFPHLLVIGLALGCLRAKSGSLYPCMAMHFTHNLLWVLTEMGGR